MSRYVINRRGEKEEMDLGAIQSRIKSLKNMIYNLDRINVVGITIDIVNNLKDNIKTSELDDIAAWICYTKSIEDEQYEVLAARIEISNLHKNTNPSFSGVIREMHKINYIRDEILLLIDLYGHRLDAMIIHENDYQYDYFGIKTLQNSYLMRKNNIIVERPQYLLMRVALELYRDDIDAVQRAYTDMSNLLYTHATPTQYNACSIANQLSSCMLLTNRDDSIKGISKTLMEVQCLGATAAGVGVCLSNIRGDGSLIRSTNRASKGIIPFLQMYNTSCASIDQGRRRKMSVAVYIDPWHKDFLDILKCSDPDASHEIRTANLQYAVWSNRLLYKRALNSAMWSFFCPTVAPKLLNTYGDEFEKAYLQYEAEGLYSAQVPATEVYVEIAKRMIESGTPYHLNKDACNEKSNMKNVAHINCSNLCAEILIPSGSIDGQEEIGVCTLASVNLSKFIKKEATYTMVDGDVVIAHGDMDYDALETVAEKLVYNLNQVIDRQKYILKGCARSNLRHRPIGIGIQGLANVFMRMGMSMTSIEAKKINYQISEALYYGALQGSMKLAEKDGAYDTFIGSPASMGKLQPHLWEDYGSKPLDYRYDWDAVAKKVQICGLRNALLMAYMPTASTSQMLGNYASFEPLDGNIFVRTTLAGQFSVVNSYLIQVLRSLNIWNGALREQILKNEGSVQRISEIPQNIRDIFKVSYEYEQKTLMEMAADRGRFICQTQSLNIFMNDPSINKVCSMMIYGMSLGLKTISYYLRSNAAVNPVNITLSNPRSRHIDSDSIIFKPTTECESCSA